MLLSAQPTRPQLWHPCAAALLSSGSCLEPPPIWDDLVPPESPDSVRDARCGTWPGWAAPWGPAVPGLGCSPHPGRPSLTAGVGQTPPGSLAGLRAPCPCTWPPPLTFSSCPVFLPGMHLFTSHTHQHACPCDWVFSRPAAIFHHKSHNSLSCSQHRPQ